MAGTSGQTRKSIVIDFSVMNKEAVTNIQQLKKQIDELKVEQKLLEIQGKQSSEQYIKNAAAIKAYTDSLKANEKELVNNAKAMQAEEGSLNSMRATLRSLEAQYADLSKEEREGAKGKELFDKMTEQRYAVEALEHSMGDFGRQVGNYGKGVQALLQPITAIRDGFMRLSEGTGKVSVAFKNGIGSVKAFGAQLLKLMMNPIVALIAAIVAALKLLVDQFKKNDQAMTALQQVFAAFKPIIDVVNKAFQALVGTLGKALGKMAEFVTKVVSLIPSLSKYAEAEQDVVKATDDLEEAQRKAAVQEAENNKKIAELRNKAVQSDKYSYEERKTFLEDAMKLEKQNLETKKKNAEEELRIAEEEAALAVGAAEYSEELWDKLSDEVKNNLTQLRTNIISAETEYENGTRRMQSQISNFTKNAAKEWAEYRKNAKDAEISLQDIILDKYDETLQAQSLKFRSTIQKQIRDIEEQLKDSDAKLTSTARKAMQEQIRVLKEQLIAYRKMFGETFEQNAIIQTLNEQQTLLQSQLDATIEGTEERYKKEDELRRNNFELEKAEYDKHIQELQSKISEIQSEQSLSDAELKRRAELAGLTIEQYKNMMQQQMDLLEAELTQENELKRNAEKKFNNESEAREIQHQRELANIKAQTASQQLENEVLKQINDINAKEVESEQAKQILIAQIQEQAAENRLRIAEEEYNRMKNLSEDEILFTYGTQEKYNLALEQQTGNLIKAQGDLQTAQKNTTKSLLAQQTTTINAYKQIANAITGAMQSMQELFTAMAEDNSAMADFATALAIMQIQVTSAVAVVEAIAAATQAGASFGVLAPAMIPVFIAELVGIVLGNIASTVSTLMQAKQNKPSVPKFATGGLIDQGKSGVDRVPIMATKGEYVIRKDKVDELGVSFFDRINFGKALHIPNFSGHYANGGQVQASAIDYDQMKQLITEGMADALIEMPNPIVDVRQITDQQRRVAIKQQIAKN